MCHRYPVHTDSSSIVDKRDVPFNIESAGAFTHLSALVMRRISEHAEKSRGRERERKRGVVDNPDRSNVFMWLCARIYGGHSLAEAMRSRQRPLSPPDMSHLCSTAITFSVSLSFSFSPSHPPAAADPFLYTLPRGSPLPNRKPQRATALIKRAIDRHYR